MARHRIGARRDAGFTLIELLVVVLIIGILASLAVPQYFKVVERSRVTEAANFAGVLRSAQERYMARTGAYITQNTLLNQLDLVFGNGTECGGTAPEHTCGMKNFNVQLGVGGGNCSPQYNVNLTRRQPQGGNNNVASVSARYGAYVLRYERCNDTYDFPSCPGANTQACNVELHP